MAHEIDKTHDAGLESWIESANEAETEFPIQNLPLCRGVVGGGDREIEGVRIGDCLVDVPELVRSGLLEGVGIGQDDAQRLDRAGLGAWYGGLDGAARRAVRSRLVELLGAGNGEIAARGLLDRAVVGVDEVDRVESVFRRFGSFTDFYASVEHATNVGSMFRPDNPLLPNYKHVPIAYHGRATSVVQNGSGVRRPVGQLPPSEEGGGPRFGPCALLDYELEVGVVIGQGNGLGERIGIERAESHVLGLCLVNDWSARDIQKWEYQPLGPFLSKSFATTVSPYVVTMEALAPFRCGARVRGEDDPAPLEYLSSERNETGGGIEIVLEVLLRSAEMRARSMEPVRLSRGSFAKMWWTVAQMVTHHTVNGCNLEAGDLLGSGTVSGRDRASRGCLLELTWDGDPFGEPPIVVPGTQRTALELPTGEQRRFLEDGDEVILRGWCEREGHRRIGFGSCVGLVEPARA